MEVDVMDLYNKAQEARQVGKSFGVIIMAAMIEARAAKGNRLAIAYPYLFKAYEKALDLIENEKEQQMLQEEMSTPR
jgi:hypothetical protein